MQKPQRFIGIRHRIKKTAEGEAHPTQVAIVADGKVRLIDLKDEEGERDFVMGTLPISWRKVDPSEDISSIDPRHVDTSRDTIKVPEAYDGLRAGDTVGMILGGSGDYLAFSLSRRAHLIDAKMMRLPAFILKAERGEVDKAEDAPLLARLATEKPELFYEVTVRDQNLMLVTEQYRARVEAMKARIECQQRLRQRFTGRIFREPAHFPEGSIEDAFNAEKANDIIMGALVREEKARNNELTKALENLEIYNRLFEPIDGCGPMIAARLIAAIQDIRRFSTKHKLKAFCGVHVMPDGRFPRRRHGETSNWNPDARQALFLLGDQFNRRPDSVWGQKLREYKIKLRGVHPEVVLSEKGKKRYTDGHIHKMALWRTITKFVERLYRDWWAIELELQAREAERNAA